MRFFVLVTTFVLVSGCSRPHANAVPVSASARSAAATLLVPARCVSDSGVAQHASGFADVPFFCDDVDLEAVSEQLLSHFSGLGWKRDAPVPTPQPPWFAWNAPAGQEARAADASLALELRGIHSTWHGRWFDDNDNVIVYDMKAGRFGSDPRTSLTGYGVMRPAR